MHHVTPFNVAERFVVRPNPGSPQQDRSAAPEAAADQTSMQANRRESNDVSPLLIWPHQGGVCGQQTHSTQTTKNVATGLSPLPCALTRDWQDMHDLPAMLKTPVAPRRLSSLFCSTQQRRINLGPSVDTHNAKQIPTREATHLSQYDSSRHPDTTAIPFQDLFATHVLGAPTALESPINPAQKPSAWTYSFPANTPQPNQAAQLANSLPLQYTEIVDAHDLIAETDWSTAEDLTQSRPALQGAYELSPNPCLANTQIDKRYSTTQAQKQLQHLHNASTWLQSPDVSSQTRQIKLVLSYLAYAHLTHEQIVESHISEAVQSLTQHTDADIQKAAAHCLSKWQLVQQAHQRQQDFIAMQQY